MHRYFNRLRRRPEPIEARPRRLDSHQLRDMRQRLRDADRAYRLVLMDPIGLLV